MKEQWLDMIDSILESTTSIKNHVDKVSSILFELNGLLSDDEKIAISYRMKDKVQKEALFAINHFEGFGAILMATGTGKTKVAVDRMKQIIEHDKNATIYVAVPTEILRDIGWPEEVKKWGAELVGADIRFLCYASLSSVTQQKFHLILDEGHNITDNNSVIFNNNDILSCMVMTATKPSDLSKIEVYKKYQLYPVYQLDLKEAIKLSIASPYHVTVINMKLDDKDKYIKAGSKTKPFMTTEKAQYIYLTKICNDDGNKFSRINRMRFIYNLKSKTNIAKLILHHVIPQDIRTLIFCGGIEQAEQVCSCYYHSKTDDTCFNRFKNKEEFRMACVDAIDEGHNIDEPDCAFMIKISSSLLAFKQRLGRMVRFRPNYIANIIILCVEDTVEKTWVNTVLEDVDEEYIDRVNLVDLRAVDSAIKLFKR